MNRYGVVVCPNCRKAKGIELSQKTTRCHKCGKLWKVRNLRILYETNSAVELQKAVAIANDKISRGDKWKSTK
jgi:ribosomal protein L37AE/L43A